MSKFKEGDLVKVIADKTPEQKGAHLIGFVGRIVNVRRGIGNHWAGSDYKYTVEAGLRSILANADELELHSEDDNTVTMRVTAGGGVSIVQPEEKGKSVFPIGSTVEVDVDMPHSQWHRALGIVMDKPYSDGKYKVKLIKDGPNGRLRDLIGSTCLLTGLTKPALPFIPDPTSADVGKRFGPKVDTSKYTGSKQGVAHYAAGMPEGIEPMDIIRAQGYAYQFAWGNALKYLCRAQYKGTQLVDLKKTRDYLNEAIDVLEQEQA